MTQEGLLSGKIGKELIVRSSSMTQKKLMLSQKTFSRLTMLESSKSQEQGQERSL
jgi:hypothetical protein